VPTLREGEEVGNTSGVDVDMDVDVDQQLMFESTGADILPDVTLPDVPLFDVSLPELPVQDMPLSEARPDRSVSEV
jgi:hypothetical protein